MACATRGWLWRLGGRRPAGGTAAARPAGPALHLLPAAPRRLLTCASRAAAARPQISSAAPFKAPTAAAKPAQAVFRRVPLRIQAARIGGVEVPNQKCVLACMAFAAPLDLTPCCPALVRAAPRSAPRRCGCIAARRRWRRPSRRANVPLAACPPALCRRYVEFSLQYIFGIGHTTAKAILASTGVENKRTKVRRWRRPGLPAGLPAGCRSPAASLGTGGAARRRAEMCGPATLADEGWLLGHGARQQARRTAAAWRTTLACVGHRHGSAAGAAVREGGLAAAAVAAGAAAAAPGVHS